MMLVQHMSTPPMAPPDHHEPPIHERVNVHAPDSVLQLGKARWTASQSTTGSSTSSESATAAILSTTSSNTTDNTTISSTSSLPSSPAFTISPASAHHASQIRHIGSTVFALTFGFSIPPSDLAAYLDSSYSLSAIQADLASPASHFLVATAPPSTSPDAADGDDAEPEVLGFAQLTEHTTEPCLSHLDPTTLVELQRLYVLPKHHGKGVGRALCRAAEEVARSKLGYGYVWLGVWEGNFVAQSVYEKEGYARVGDHEFRMGRCVQIDWIMGKEL